jgi:formylglycine-generating enzyme required for sulfatase activity
MVCEVPMLARTRRAWRDAAEFPRMVELCAGEFVMGENTDDKFATDTERPAHRVTIPCNFALGSFPVTVGEFRRFHCGHAPGETDDLPVVRVSWHEAVAYCEWLTLQSGRSFRLPTEAEWEFACRAGSRTPFAPGHEISPAQANYFYDENGLRIGAGRRTPVGHYAPNAFGIFDLHGNVCEWVADAWHPDYHGAPADGRVWTDAGADRHVIRGGAWDYLPRLLRSAWRDWRPMDCRADNIGFRVATSDLENIAA